MEELPKADLDPLPYDDPLEQLLRAVKGFPAPVIAMVHGSVWGGACDLVMACDIVYGDETCSFAITPAKIGLPYNLAGFLNFMSRLPLAVVKEMFFTAEPIAAERAERVGIINAVVPAAELESRVQATARVIASRSPMAIAAFKESIRALSEAAPMNPETFEYLHGLRRRVYFGPDYREGVSAFLKAAHEILARFGYCARLYPSVRSRESRNPVQRNVPAFVLREAWIPAFAGMNGEFALTCSSQPGRV